MAACDALKVAGRRDKLILGLLTGAGLRREELVNLRWDDVIGLPRQGKLRTALSIRGKGARHRVIPINEKLAKALDQWAGVVGRNGYVIRSLGMNREPGERISAEAIFYIVRAVGEKINKPHLSPQDLRRTYAQLGYEAGVPITQISKLLGHASLATTQRYLNLDLDPELTVSDFIPFE